MTKKNKSINKEMNSLYKFVTNKQHLCNSLKLGLISFTLSVL